MPDTPLRILSLDGGGVRGISSLYILKELMAQIAREHNQENPDRPDLSPLPCEYFDLICGTSTGGLIALMLGRLRMLEIGFSDFAGIRFVSRRLLQPATAKARNVQDLFIAKIFFLY